VSPKRTLGIGLAVALALLTSACAAGQQASTANEQNTLDGVNADVGMIHIRGMVVEPPTKPSFGTGDDATVKVVLVNVGNKTDQLQSITSPVMSDWGAFTSTADADQVIAAGPTSTASQGPLPSPGKQVLIPAGGRVSYGTPEATGALVFLHFTKAVFPGTTIPVTLRFAQAGSVTVPVPIGLSNSVNTSPIATPSGVEG
jgi:copper(I)-binding protein